VQSVYDELSRLKPVLSEDHRTLVQFVDEIEQCYSQLAEIGQTFAITMSHIDKLIDKLPNSIKEQWCEIYGSLSVECKVHPLPSFMEFMEDCRRTVSRLAERQTYINENKTYVVKQNKTHVKTLTFHRKSHSDSRKCLIHNNAKHSTEECKVFYGMSVDDRFKLVKTNKACFRCFGAHRRTDCKSRNGCSNCNDNYHHSLL